MSGPIKTRADAVAKAGILALKFREFARKMQKKSGSNKPVSVQP